MMIHVWPFVGPVLLALLLDHAHKPKPHPKPVFVAEPAAHVCYWHQYAGHTDSFEVCDDHRTGRTRKGM